MGYITTSVGVKNTNYFQRTYSNLPVHSFVYYVINVIAIDSWGSSDTYSIAIDGRAVATWKPADYLAQYGDSICGDSNINDFLTTIIGKISHSSDSLTLKLTTNIVSKNLKPPGLGISDIFLSFPTSVITTESSYLCPDNTCIYKTQTCSIFQYETSGACITGCNNCEYPWGTQAGQTHRCPEGFSFDGNTCVQCQTDCFFCSDSMTGSCNRCQKGFLLDLDGECRVSCQDATSIIKGTGTAQYCIEPCPSGKFMLWDFSCVSSCEAPLSQRSTPDQGDFCDYECEEDGTEYLYWNGSCKSKCEYPYKSRVYGENLFCDLPCEASSEFLYEDGSCLETCPEPKVISQYDTTGSVQFCLDPTLSAENLNKIQSLADSLNTLDEISNYALLALNVIFPANPGITLKKSLNNMLFSLRYLNISGSLELQALYSMVNLTSNDYTGHNLLSDDLADKFTDSSPPKQFTRFGLHANFLVNYGNTIIWMLILVAIVIALLLLEWIFRRLQNIRRARLILHRSRITLQNYFFGQFYAGFAQVIFFACLDWMTENGSDDRLSGLSTTLLLFSLIIGVFIVLINLYLIFRYRKIKRGNSDTNELTVKLNQFKRKQEGFLVFFEDFKDTSVIRQATLLILIFRCIIINLIIVLGYDSPLLQISVILVINSTVLIYFLIIQPFKYPIEFFQQILFELALCAANSCTLVLFLANDSDTYHPTVINNASNGIIITCFIFICIPLIFLILRVIIAIYKKFKKPPIKLPKTKETMVERLSQSNNHLLDTSSFVVEGFQSPPLEPEKLKGTSGVPPMESNNEDFEVLDSEWQGKQASPLKRRLKIRNPRGLLKDEGVLNEVLEVDSSINNSEKSLLQLETETTFMPVRENNMEDISAVPEDFNELPEGQEGEGSEEGVVQLKAESEFVEGDKKETEIDNEKDAVLWTQPVGSNRESALIASFGFSDK